MKKKKRVYTPPEVYCHNWGYGSPEERSEMIKELAEALVITNGEEDIIPEHVRVAIAEYLMITSLNWAYACIWGGVNVYLTKECKITLSVFGTFSGAVTGFHRIENIKRDVYLVASTKEEPQFGSKFSRVWRKG